MEFISSDTNVWVDFRVISRIELPFRLPYTYIMYTESITSELLTPVGFREELTAAGLVGVDLTIEEFFLAESWGRIYPRLSVQDRIALAIAKERRIILLTGDMALRKAAVKEGVKIMGTLGIFRPVVSGRLYFGQRIQGVPSGIAAAQRREVRLPRAELKRRLEEFDGGL